jgi:hypothetical protein
MTLREQLHDMTEAQLIGLNKLVVKELNSRQTRKSEDFIRSLEVGDRVKWKSRRGLIDHGAVVKCHRTTAIVLRDGGGKVKVHGSMMSRSEREL